MKSVIDVREVGSRHWVGDGFEVRNLFPTNGLKGEVNPFLLFDYAGPTSFAPSDKPRGVDEHPHRGFETVTIVYQGGLEHRDSSGNAGKIGPGDVQWMTAASGVVHEEKHAQDFTKQGGTFEVVQLWVNLPAAYKMSPPRYQGLTKDEIPIVRFGNGAVRVIAGEIAGTSGPAKTFTPITLLDVQLGAGDVAEFDLPEGQRTSVALLRGNVLLGDTELQGEAKIALLSDDTSRVRIEARADSILLVLAGEPIDEPVKSYGPFVMNTHEELVQAVEDYQAGKMGSLR